MWFKINFNIGCIAFSRWDPFNAYKAILLNDVFRFEISKVLKVLLNQLIVHLFSKSLFLRHNDFRDNFRFLSIRCHQLCSFFGLSSSLDHMINNVGTSIWIWCDRNVFFLNCILRLQFLSLLFFFLLGCFVSLFIRHYERLRLSSRKHVCFVLKV